MAFTGTTRVLMLVNSCINPVIYASAVPAFKKLAKGLLRCNLARKLTDMKDTSETLGLKTWNDANKLKLNL